MFCNYLSDFCPQPNNLSTRLKKKDNHTFKLCRRVMIPYEDRPKTYQDIDINTGEIITRSIFEYGYLFSFYTKPWTNEET